MKKVYGKLAMICIAAIAAVAVLCGCGDKPAPKGEPIVGTYYCETAEGEYTLSLGEFVYTLTRGEATESGTYAVTDGVLSFTANGAQTMTAQKADDGTLRLSIGDALPMRMLPKVEYTVTFASAGGSAVAAEKAVNGKSLYTLPVSVREGFVFGGWFTDENTYKTPFVFGETAVTADVTLYARWIAETETREFAVTFVYDDGARVSISTVNGKVPYAPVSPAGNFAGWWTSVGGDKEKLTEAFAADETVFDRDTSLYPVFASLVGGIATPLVQVTETRVFWQNAAGADKYSVKVAPVGGTAVLEKDVTETSLSVPFASYPAGEYEISVTAIGDGEDAGDGVTTVRHFQNRILRAVEIFSVEGDTLRFESIPHATGYFVTAVCADGAHNAETTRVSAAAPQFDFSGCEMGEDGIRFVVTAAGDDWQESAPAEYVCKRTLSVPEGFAADGDGNLTWGAVTGAQSYAVAVTYGGKTDTTTVTAPKIDIRGYDKGTVTVAVTPHARTYLAPDATQYIYEKKAHATPQNLRVENAQYLTWDAITGATYEIGIDGGTPTRASTNRFDLLTATAGAHTVRVRTVASDGTPSAWSDPFTFNNADRAPTDLKYENGLLTWAAPVGQTIDGFRLKVGANGAVRNLSKFAAQAKISFAAAGTQTVYLCSYYGTHESEWSTLDIQVYTLHLYAEGADTPAYYATGDELALSDASKTGYTFTGWYDAETGGTRFTARRFEYAKDISLYAHWAAKTYTVTFELSGGSGVDTTAEVTYDAPFSWGIPTAASSEQGFAGWYTGVNGSGTRLTDADGESLRDWTADGNLTVYACYRAVLSFRLTRNLAGEDSYSVVCGEGAYSVSSITVPERYEGKLVTVLDGYAFRNCTRLRTLSLPDTLEIVEAETAFIGCVNLQTLTVRTTGLTREVFVSAQNNILVYKNNTTGYYEVKYVPRGLTGTVTLPDNATQIPGGAFEDVSAEKIVVSGSVVRIEKDAFAGSAHLTTVEFAAGEAALDIAAGAFSGCTHLQSVSLPARYSRFDPQIFSRCDALVSVKIADNDTYSALEYETGKWLLTNRAGNTLVYFPCGATALTVPTRIIALGERAFVGSHIVTISLPATVTRVGRYAFANCTYLRTVRFLAGGQAPVVIEESAFAGCTRLDTVTFDEGSRVSEIGALAFSGDTSLTSFTFPAYMTKVGANAFENCRTLHTVSFAPGGQNIVFAAGVFRNCTILTTIELPATVDELYSSAFEGCDGLTSIVVDPANPHFTAENGVLYNKAKTEVLFVPKGKSMIGFRLAPTVEKIGEAVFKGRTTLTEFEIGNKVTEIGAAAFADCSNLRTVTFASGRAEDATLTFAAGEGGGDADKKGVFSGCAQLGEIALPAGVTGVPAYTFYECTSLRKVTFGEGITEIGAYAFYRCAVVEPVFPSTLTKIGAHAFQRASYDDNPPSGTLTFAEGLTEIGDEAFQYTGYTAITLPTTVTSLGTSLFYRGSMRAVTFIDGGTAPLTLAESVFAECPIASVALPSRLTALPAYMFGYSYASSPGSMKTLTVPAAVTSIGNYAFTGAKSLQTITFAPSETAIEFGTNVFQGLTSLSTIEGLGARLHEIPANMFGGCSRLASFDFTGVTRIGNGAFAGSGLTAVNFGETLVSIGDNAFSNTRLQSVTIPASVTSIGEAAFSACARLGSVEFATGGNADLVITDGNGTYSGSTYAAFYNCGNLTTVTNIPARMTRLAAYLFANCAKLSTVTFEKGGTMPLDIGTNAFTGCAALTSLTLPARLGVAPAKTMFNQCNALTELAVDTADTVYAGVRKFVSSEGVVYEADGAGDPVTAVYCPFAKAGEVHIPATVTTVNDNAFGGCNKLTGIYFVAGGSAPLTVGSSASASNYSGSGPFNGCTNAAFTTIVLPGRLVKLGTNAFNGLKNLTQITFEDGTADLEIGNYAFVGTGVTELVLPARTETVGTTLFMNCSALTRVTIPANASGLEKALVGSKIPDLTLSGNGATVTNGMILGGNGTILLFYTGTAAIVTIPATVTTIAEGVFMHNTTLQEVIFESGSALTSIGAQAFYGCDKLTRADLPDGVVTIGKQAFYGCAKLQNIRIPASVRDTRDGETVIPGIGESAFEGCKLVQSFAFATADGQDGDLTVSAKAFNGVGQNTELTQKLSIELPDRVISLGGSAFAYAKIFGAITYSEHSRLAYMGDSMFQGGCLTSFVIPACMTEVPSGMFNYCLPLEHVTFAGGTILKIGRNAFADTAIDSIDIPDSVSVIEYAAFRNCKNLSTVELPSALVELGENVFDSSGLTSITIPGSVTTFGRSIFYNCKALDSVTFAEGVTSLPAGTQYGSSATGSMFDGCEMLREVNLPSSLTSIGAYAFYKAGTKSESLDIVVPASVTAVGTGAFRESGLTQLTFENGATVSEIGEDMCRACTRLTTASLRGLSAVTRTMFSNCEALETVLYGEALTSIGDYAFQYCEKLERIEVSARLQTVGYATFSGCAALTSFAIPRGLATVGEFAFSNCENLTEITGWEHVEEVGRQAFQGIGVTELHFTSALRKLGTGAFAGCPNLTTVLFDDGATTIGSSAFSECENLIRVKLPTTLTEIAADAFDGCTKLTAYEMDGAGGAYCVLGGILYNATATTLISVPKAKSGEISSLPATLTKIGRSAFEGTGITSIIVPEGVTVIESYAFYNCRALQTVSLPATLVEIGSWAFRAEREDGEYKTALREVTFAPGCVLTSIGDYAFYGCTSISQIEIPSGVTKMGSSVFNDWTSAQTICFGVPEQIWTNDGFSSWDSGCHAILRWSK